MRLITRKIYRAFPELDEYDDAQCVRFVRAAKGGRDHALVRGAAMIGVGILGGFFAITSAVAAARWLESKGPVWRGDLGVVLAVLIAIPAVVSGPLGMYVMRDVMLRLRVRKVLRTRGVCGECRYSLVGLEVSRECTVVCPECRTVTRVDPSLAELARQSGGQLLATEAMMEVRSPPSMLMRRLKQVATVVAVVAVLLGIVAGAVEWSIRRQASRANAVAVQAAADLEKIMQALPKATGVSGQRLLAETEEFLRDAVTKATVAMPETFDTLVKADWQIVTTRGTTPAEERERARVAIRAFREAGLMDRLAAIAKADAGREPPAEGNPDPGRLWFMDFSAWKYVDAAAGVLGEAMERGDEASALAAIEAVYATARIAAADPRNRGLIEWAYISLHADRMAQAFLSKHPTAQAIRRLEEVIARQDASPDPALAERVALLEARLGVGQQYGSSRSLRSAMMGWVTTRIGRRQGPEWKNFDEMLAETESAIVGFGAELTMDAPARPSTQVAATTATQTINVWMLRTRDLREASRRGLGVMIALEKHRAAAGSYPDALDALLPEFAVKAADPFSGTPIRYRKKDFGGWEYVVYLDGEGIDDGGNGPLIGQYIRVRAGQDELINVPVR